MSPFVRTHNDFLLTFHSVHLVYLVPFSRQRAISVENRKKNPTPLYFASQLKEFSLDLGTSLGGGSENKHDGAIPGRQKV